MITYSFTLKNKTKVDMNEMRMNDIEMSYKMKQRS